ncbi:hypothetical protein SLEP1_g39369 [Rubroshorea leprosula]|uniref:Uncharacterized protein n=1 Tax=Rubroshorea leprosula TaxID=152421 RepID=A0AAV5KZZ7_9ROSI|nr:hypothetical protein SLEP1_g39369 [Rubroshorea leprosula]
MMVDGQKPLSSNDVLNRLSYERLRRAVSRVSRV